MPQDAVTLPGLTVTARRGIPTFKPRCTITLHKLITRSTTGDGVASAQRVRDAVRDIDLTPYLGLGSNVTVDKSCRSMAGMWSATFVDKQEPSGRDSLYGLVEPMDMVTISMQRSPTAGAAPVMMRGFVSRVQHGETMTPQGPRRFVTLSGQDYGKVLDICQVLYLPQLQPAADLLTTFKLWDLFGVNPVANQDAAAFVQAVNDRVITPFLSKMQTAAGTSGLAISSLRADLQADIGAVAPFGSQDWQGGPISSLLATFADAGRAGFCELFVEDRDDGPYLVYRANPFKSLAGEALWKGSVIADPIPVHARQILSISAERSDADIANFYWVAAPRMMLLADSTFRQLSLTDGFPPSPIVDKYPNCDPALYGWRTLMTQTEQGVRADGGTSGEVDGAVKDATALIGRKRQFLIDANKDNGLLEHGTIELRGDEAIKAGRYLSVTREDLSWEVYAHSVRHTFNAYQSFETLVTFDRGTGYARRVEKAGSPYASELHAGGVYD